MGKVKYRDALMSLFRKTPVVSVDSVRKIAGEYAYLLLHKMEHRGEIHRITKGWYSLLDDPAIAVFCFQPAYLGLQDALSIHNLWEQETNAVIMTTKTVRQGVRRICGANAVMWRIPMQQYFGVEYVQYGGTYVPVSDIEKTLLDMVYFRQPIEREVLVEAQKQVDGRKLQEYVKKYGPGFARLFLEKTGSRILMTTKKIKR